MNKLLLLFLSFVTLMGAPKFLMPEEAFKTSAEVNENSQIVAKVEIAKDIYLYQEAIKLEIAEGSGLKIANIDSPEAVEHHGDMAYVTSPTFVVDLESLNGSDGIKEVEFLLSYQGCSEQGLCYEPYTDTFELKVDTSKLSSSTSSAELKPLDVKTNEAQKSSVEKSETDMIADVIKNSSTWMILLTFFGFGLLMFGHNRILK